MVPYCTILYNKNYTPVPLHQNQSLRFWRTKFSYYDYGAEFNIYSRRNIYTFVYKTVWLI